MSRISSDAILPNLGLITLPHDGLFDIPAAKPEAAARLDSPISPRQVQQLRSAFDGAEIMSMDERQKIIQQSTGRQVENIRLLFSREVMAILSHIDRTGRRVETARNSAWDDREEDTWIDKL